ncbi:alpha/beta fold hydrolase [Nocardia suismassiliense]|uniref:Alpha/beta fold hydrolase n=1 Tax=Nocardia suismassiliense TaxID=2077092 RepID=A0ABW6R3Q0_9NOCA
MNVSVDAPTRLGTTRLPDGRSLGWSEWGPPDGVPVLLCPGAATSRRLGFGTDLLAQLGVRLISVDRPGLGISTPAPGRSLHDFAEDMRDFTAARQLGDPAVVGNSQGAPFALACAEAGVATALAVVSGADDIAAPEFATALPETLRDLVDLAARDAVEAERFFAGFTAAGMWDLVIETSAPSDVAVYRHPTFAAAYRRALAEAFAPGADGYARDTVLAMRRWPLRLDRIAVPVDLWYGALDTGHSPDKGAFLTTRIPGARRHLVPDAGGALLWTHAEAVLTTLLERMRA